MSRYVYYASGRTLNSKLISKLVALGLLLRVAVKFSEKPLSELLDQTIFLRGPNQIASALYL